ncbi:exosortase/archaeosortase family protein [Desulfobulbus elongatus]|uniref:exosortase/archaeosortase family protein n=1 Tax=Desulfobulbus elongatus TaxID=53332 RepID=UPI000480B6CD|nr:exosortase/archaeosortase family protein [Desulfobulbus elongatus]
MMNSSRERNRTLLLFSFLAVLFVVAYYPAFIGFARKWSASEDYAHAFFTVPIIIYMIWTKKEAFLKQEGNSVVGLPLVVGSISLYLLSLQLQIPTIMFVATMLTVVSTLIYFCEFRIVKALIIPIMLLFLLIPIPNQLLSAVTAALQLKVSEASELIVQLLAIPLFREGNVLHIPDKTFQVVEACSGIRSLISLSTLSLIFGYFTLRTWWATSLLLLLSVPIAIFINIVRVVSMVVVYRWYAIDLTEGTAHTVAGLVLFLLGFFMLGLFQRILESWETK